MMSSSMMRSLAGTHVGWMMKTSQPRIFSLICTNVSPSGKQLTVAEPSGSPRFWQISWASAGLAFPVKIFIAGKVMDWNDHQRPRTRPANQPF